MFKYFIKITLRNILKYKSYSLFNIAGLSVGLACAILIFMWVRYELSYDRWHNNAGRIYRVVDEEKYSTGETGRFAVNPAAMGPLLVKNYPEIFDAVRVRKFRNCVLQYNDRRFKEEALLCADASLFTVFFYPFVQGDPAHALANPSNIVITHSLANKYFGDADPLGKVMRLNNQWDYTVSGVLKDVPLNSYLDFDVVIPFESVKNFGLPADGWSSYAYTIFVLLDSFADPNAVSQKIANVVSENTSSSIITLSLQPLTDIHLRSGDMMGVGGSGDIRYVYIFSIIAVFVLMLACINFMNMTTARSANRAKEVGLRKVVGAGRSGIALQFLGESLIMSVAALGLAVLLVQWTLPFFNSVSGKELSFTHIGRTGLILFLAGITLFTGLISGAYPALFLSAFRPIKILKGIFASGSKGAVFRKILVSVQFVITIFLLISTVVVNRQLRFLQNRKLGFNKDFLLMVDFNNSLTRQTDLVKQVLQKCPGVINVASVSEQPYDLRHSVVMDEWEGREENENILAYLLSADYDFLRTMELEMAEGRYFSRDIFADTAKGIILNQTAIRDMGMTEPVGKKAFDRRIIGVIKDFHFKSLHKKIAPIVIYFAPHDMKYLLVRIQGKNVDHILASLEMAWDTAVPGFPFEYHFIDEQIDTLYKTERQIEDIVNAFTVIALFIACLGLFALASFATEQRTKEVGIRKVLGATISGLFLLLSKEFLYIVGFASILSWPMAYLFLSIWLQSYAYRVQIGFGTMVGTTLAALLIGLLTVSLQAGRTALENPVKSLRYE
ncbi:ABC transporter permease [candidate division KSB1 bacterium]|nr:ABC transporter permease [candidate division KSB1 bacterium]